MPNSPLTRFSVLSTRPPDNTNGLLAWWPLLDGSATDFSGQQTNGTLTNAPQPASGLGGWNALTFDGSSNYVVGSQLFNQPVATVTAWVKKSGHPATEGLIAGLVNGIGSSVYDKVLSITTAGQLNWHVYDGSAKNVTSAADITDGQWHHCAGTCDGTTSRLYLDGALVGSLAAGNSYTGYTQPNLFLNGNTSGGGPVYLSCVSGDLRFYARALSAAEIYAVYAQSLTGAMVGERELPALRSSVTFTVVAKFAMGVEFGAAAHASSVTLDEAAGSLRGQAALVAEAGALVSVLGSRAALESGARATAAGALASENLAALVAVGRPGGEIGAGARTATGARTESAQGVAAAARGPLESSARAVVGSLVAIDASATLAAAVQFGEEIASSARVSILAGALEFLASVRRSSAAAAEFLSFRIQADARFVDALGARAFASGPRAACLPMRRFVSVEPPRPFSSRLGSLMPQGSDFGTMDVGETVNGAIDFGRWLAPGEAIASIVSVTAAIPTGQSGACVAIVGSPQVGTAAVSQGGTGAVNKAVLQQWTGIAPGVARITATITTSLGQTLIGWGHQPVAVPN